MDNEEQFIQQTLDDYVILIDLIKFVSSMIVLIV